MPHVLIASWFIMLPCRNPFTSICTSHSKCCKLRSAVNLSSVIRRQLIDVLEMLIGHHKNMSFIVWPPLARYKCCYLFILIDNIPLFCSLVRSFDAPNTAKWTFVSFGLVRKYCCHLYFPTPLICFLLFIRRRQLQARPLSIDPIPGGYIHRKCLDMQAWKTSCTSHQNAGFQKNKPTFTPKLKI